MGILNEIARGGRTSALDVAKARTQGEDDRLSLQVSQQNLHLKSMEMQEFTNKQNIRERTAETMDASDIATVSGLKTASKDVFGIGNSELGMNLLREANLQQGRSDKADADYKKLLGKGLDLKSPEGKKFGDMFTLLNKMPPGESRTAMMEVLNNSIDQKQRKDESVATDKMSKTADDIATTSLGLNMEDIDNVDFNLLASTANSLLQGGKNIHQARSHISKYYEENKSFGFANRVELKSEWSTKVDILRDPTTGRSFYADGNTFVGWVD